MKSQIDILRGLIGRSKGQKGDISRRQSITIAVCVNIDTYVYGVEYITDRIPVWEKQRTYSSLVNG